MAIPLGFSRFVLEGHIEGGEIFQVGCWSAQAPDGNDAANTMAAAVANAFVTAVPTTTPASFLASDEAWDRVRVYSYTTGGPDAQFVGVANITGGAGTGSRSMPNQVALCFTMETGLAGRRNRGRMYLPFKGAALTDGQLTASTVTSFSAWMADFIAKVNAAVTQPCVVLSQTAGSANPITQIRVDTRLDIQRRRADRQAPIAAVFTDVAGT